MKIINVLIILLFAQAGFAQSQMLKASDSDPKARKILDALRKEYNSYKSSEINFELIIELPNKSKEIQKGKMIQSGKKFQITTNDQDIYCDGKTSWLYLKSNKEVQINNYEEGMENNMVSPADMIKMYDNGKYAYAISGTELVNGVKLTNIEFKPLDKNSEYSKLRLSVDTKTNKPVSMKIFSKDGSRFTLSIKNILPNKAYATDVFVFNPKKYPGVRVEDLRID